MAKTAKHTKKKCDSDNDKEYQDSLSEDQEKEEAIKEDMRKRTKKKKRYEVEEKEEERADIALKSLLSDLKGGLNKTMTSKRQKLESFTEQCCSCHQKVDQLTEDQDNIRTQMMEEYQKQFSSICDQWETDYEKAKGVEDKIRNLLNQQMKLIAQERQVQLQRVKSMKSLHEKFVKKFNETEVLHNQNRQALLQEMNSQLEETKKLFVSDMTDREIQNMRKSLSTVLEE